MINLINSNTKNMNNKSKLASTNQAMIIQKFLYNNIPFYFRYNDQINSLEGVFKLFCTLFEEHTSTDLKKLIEDIQNKPNINILESIILLFYLETENKDTSNNLAEMQKSSVFLQQYISVVFLFCLSNPNFDFPKSLWYSYLKMPLEKATWKRIRNNSLTVCTDWIKDQVSRLHLDISENSELNRTMFNKWFTFEDKELLLKFVNLQEYKGPKDVNFNQMFYLFMHNIPFTKSIESYEKGKYVNLIKPKLKELLIWFRFIDVFFTNMMTAYSDELQSTFKEFIDKIGSIKINIDKDIFNKKTYENLRILFHEAIQHYIFQFILTFSESIVLFIKKINVTNLNSITVGLTISTLVKNNPILAFLNDSIDVIEAIMTKLAIQKVLVPKEKPSHEDNFIQLDEGSLCYTSLEEWNKIYNDLVLTKDIDEHTRKDTFNIGSIMYNIGQEFSINISSRLGIFEILIKENPLLIVRIIETCMQKVTYSLVRRKDEEAKEFSLGLTYLSSILGEIIFKHLLYNSQKVFNEILTISESNLSNISTLLISILTNNDILTLKTYNDFKIIHNSKKVTLNLLNNFLLKHFIQLYIENELPNTLQVTLDSYWKHDQGKNSLIKINKELTADYIQIGYDIINLLEKQNIVSKYTLQKENKIQYMVKLKPHLVTYFSRNLRLFRPFLVQNNLDFVKEKSKDSSTYQLILDNYKEFIHINPDIELSLNKDCYLRKHRPHIKLTIDKDYYTFFLIHYINLMSKTHINISNSNSFQDILNIYNISSDDLKKIYNEVDSKDQIILDNLLGFALNFNINVNKELEKSLKTFSKKYVGRIKDIYNKIYSNKLFFVGLLKEVCIYSIFGYFIVNGFLDTRGRYYLEGYHFNVQNFPIAKAFIKPFTFNQLVDIQRHYPDIQEAFIQNLKTEKLKKVVENMSIETFSIKFKEDDISYLYKFFDSSKVSRKDFVATLMIEQNSEDLLSFVRQNKKKNEYTFLIHSYIYQYKCQIKKPFIGYYREIDSSSNGLQMTTIFLNEPNLGKKCNLLGTEKVDIYSSAGNEIKTLLLSLKEDIKTFKSYFKLSLNPKETPIIMNDIEYDKLDGASVQEKFNAVLNSIWKNSYKIGDLIKDIVKDPQVQQFMKSHSSNKHKWILDSFIDEMMGYASFQNINKDYVKYFISICKGIWFFNDLDDCPWIFNLLFERDVHKLLVMTYGYMSTFKGRIDDIIDFFKRSAPYNHVIDISKLNNIANVVEHFFKYFREKDLPECEITKEISKLVAKEKKPITIKNKFFNIIINPCKMLQSTVNIRRQNLRIQLSIECKTNKTDSNRIRTGFIPNFIHSMDAFIVHLLYEKIYHINQYFRINNINFHIPLTTTHDSYMMLMTPFLRLIIEDCYKELISVDYVNTLKSNAALYNKLITKYFHSPNKRKFFLSQTENFNPYFIK